MKIVLHAFTSGVAEQEALDQLNDLPAFNGKKPTQAAPSHLCEIYDSHIKQLAGAHTHAIGNPVINQTLISGLQAVGAVEDDTRRSDGGSAGHRCRTTEGTVGVAETAVATRPRRAGGRRQGGWVAFVYTVPALLIFAVFIASPIIANIIESLVGPNGGTTLANYRQAQADPVFGLPCATR